MDKFFSDVSSGIGGVLKDHLGTFLLHFGKQLVEVDLVIYVEILAIREALLIAIASRWATTTNFIFLGFKTIILTISLLQIWVPFVCCLCFNCQAYKPIPNCGPTIADLILIR